MLAFDPVPFHQNGIQFIPVFHGKYESTLLLREALHLYQPDCIAVEFPNTLKQVIISAVRRLPVVSVIVYEEGDGSAVYILIEPLEPLVEAIRFGLENNIPVEFIDMDVEGYKRYPDWVPDTYSLSRLGAAAYLREYMAALNPDPEISEVDELREVTMACHLERIRDTYKKGVCVCGIHHLKGVWPKMTQPQARPIARVKRENVLLANVHPDSLREILSEPAYIQAFFEKNRKNPVDFAFLDRAGLQLNLLLEAQKVHQENSQAQINLSQLKTLLKFAHNYARLDGLLLPDIYQLIVSARGVVNDNYAYEVWDLATRYPWEDLISTLPTLRLDGEMLNLGTKRIRLRRKLTSLKKRLFRIPVKKRPLEKYPGEWKASWDERFLCSYPPEDIVIENYGIFIRKKAKSVVSEEMSRVEPFLTSILDGVDIRETIRRWSEKKIYVREHRHVSGNIDSIVVIFDSDVVKEIYPWCVTWLGEHYQESDMAFYATPFGEKLVGPGICRAQYGGFMMTWPPGRLYDVWKDPAFAAAKNKPERLLMAAVDYSLEKLIAYVAQKPPRSWFKSYAGLFGKKILYIPIGQLSPPMLKKIQVFHALSGRDVRDFAKDYIS